MSSRANSQEVVIEIENKSINTVGIRISEPGFINKQNDKVTKSYTRQSSFTVDPFVNSATPEIDDSRRKYLDALSQSSIQNTKDDTTIKQTDMPMFPMISSFGISRSQEESDKITQDPVTFTKYVVEPAPIRPVGITKGIDYLREGEHLEEIEEGKESDISSEQESENNSPSNLDFNTICKASKEKRGSAIFGLGRRTSIHQPESVRRNSLNRPDTPVDAAIIAGLFGKI